MPLPPQVPFKKSFNPKDSMGNVERWLIECEAAMRDSLKDSLRRAFAAYAKTPRINWVTDWPGQVRRGGNSGNRLAGAGEGRGGGEGVWGCGIRGAELSAAEERAGPLSLASPRCLQVVICVDCMYWTKEMAEAITRGELAQYSEQCTEELMKVRAGEGWGGREGKRLWGS